MTYHCIFEGKKCPVVLMLDIDGDETDDPFLAEIVHISTGPGCAAVFIPDDGDIRRDKDGKQIRVT